MKRNLIGCSVWALVLAGMWWAYSGAVPPTATVPMVTSQVPGTFYIERVQVALDLFKDGEVTTPANYTPDKVDRMPLAEANKFARAMCVYYKRCTAVEWDGDPEADPPVPAMSADDRAKLYIDFQRYMHIHSYKQIYGDDAVDAFRATKYDELETEARASIGEDEYEPPEDPE